MIDPYRVRITTNAYNDLRAIFDYIAADSVAHASSVVRRLLKQVDSLDLFPTRAKRIGWSPELHAAIHSLPSKPFVIYFAVLQSKREVHVIHIRHGARDNPRFS